MLLLQNPGAQRLGGIVFEDGHRRLEDNGAGVDLFGHEVNGAAADFDAVF